MPTEIRHILFRPPEVVHALQCHFRRQGKPLTSGRVGDCSIVGDGIGSAIAFQMKVHADGTAGQATEINVDGVTLVVALIMHCRDKQIPLPAKATKSLQRLGEQLCLVATLN